MAEKIKIGDKEIRKIEDIAYKWERFFLFFLPVSLTVKYIEKYIFGRMDDFERTIYRVILYKSLMQRAIILMCVKQEIKNRVKELLHGKKKVPLHVNDIWDTKNYKKEIK